MWAAVESKGLVNSSKGSLSSSSGKNAKDSHISSAMPTAKPPSEGSYLVEEVYL